MWKLILRAFRYCNSLFKAIKNCQAMGVNTVMGTRVTNGTKGNILVLHFWEAIQLMMLKLRWAKKVLLGYLHTESEGVMWKKLLNFRGVTRIFGPRSSRPHAAHARKCLLGHAHFLPHCSTVLSNYHYFMVENFCFTIVIHPWNFYLNCFSYMIYLKDTINCVIKI